MCFEGFQSRVDSGEVKVFSCLLSVNESSLSWHFDGPNYVVGRKLHIHDRF